MTNLLHSLGYGIGAGLVTYAYSCFFHGLDKEKPGKRDIIFSCLVALSVFLINI